MRSFVVAGLTLLAGCMPPRGGGRIAFPPLPEPQAIRVAAVPQIAGYSSAVKVGLTVYLAGQAGIDSSGSPVGEDLGLQTAQALSNVITIVRAARGVVGDIVKLTFYYVPVSPGDPATISAIVDQMLSRQHPPALTLVPVSSLPTGGLRVAVDGIAILRGELPDRARDRD
jgi:enamine deaminase RidA (YjgF/YER057c/UK114 family)